MLVAIATALKTTVEALTDEKAGSEAASVPERFLTSDESNLVRDYRALSKSDKLVARKMVRSLVRAVAPPQVDDIHEIEEVMAPIIPIATKRLERAMVRVTIRAAAGVPISSERQPDEVEVPAELVGAMKLEGCHAVGDSMVKAGILDGTLLLCEPVGASLNYHAGDVIVARLFEEGADETEGEFVVKRFAGSHKGITRLLSESDEHPTINWPRELVRVEGVVKFRQAEDGSWLTVPSESVRGRR